MSVQLPHTYHFPLPGGLHYPMALVQPGTFIMGSEVEDADADEKPEHLVSLTRPYYIGLYPLTQAIWKALMQGHNPSRFKGDNRPVEQVSWLDIVEGGQDEEVPEAFLTRLNRLCPHTDAPDVLHDFHFRLPTEAEWEYAAKGGHRTALSDAEIDNPPKAAQRYSLYAGSDKLKEVSWHSLNSHSETKAVGLKQPNELGVYDMSGNVREWCADWFDSNYYAACAQEGIKKNRLGPKMARTACAAAATGAMTRAAAALRIAPTGSRRPATAIWASAWCSSRSLSDFSHLSNNCYLCPNTSAPLCPFSYPIPTTSPCPAACTTTWP